MKLSEHLLSYKNIIFDCDGVILDSNHIKTQGFIQLFSNYPKEYVQKITKYHLKNGGKSRYKKIKYFFKNILKKDLSEKDLFFLSSRYGEIIYDKLKKANLVPGVLKTLVFLKRNNKNMYLVSGSDEKELIKLFKFRKIYDLFIKINGSPKNKEENILNSVPDLKDRKRSVYIGDSKYDYLVSKKLLLDFIFINGYSEWNASTILIKKNNILSFKNFQE